jgi:hypothetical protein
LTRAAFPHSEIPGSKVVSTSPRLIAADHVLHRLSAPKHPPHTLSSLTTESLDSVGKRLTGSFFLGRFAGAHARASGLALVIVSRFHFGTPVHMSKSVAGPRCGPFTHPRRKAGGRIRPLPKKEAPSGEGAGFGSSGRCDAARRRRSRTVGEASGRTAQVFPVPNSSRP